MSSLWIEPLASAKALRGARNAPSHREPRRYGPRGTLVGASAQGDIANFRRSAHPLPDAPMRRTSLVPPTIPRTHDAVPAHKNPIRVAARALAQWFESRGLRAQVSVSDESRYACAFVVVEHRPPLPETA